MIDSSLPVRLQRAELGRGMIATLWSILALARRRLVSIVLPERWLRRSSLASRAEALAFPEAWTWRSF